jgi:hypothetical protein
MFRSAVPLHELSRFMLSPFIDLPSGAT